MCRKRRLFDDRVYDLFVEMINSPTAFARPSVVGGYDVRNAVVTAYSQDADGTEHVSFEWATVQPHVEPKPLQFFESGRVRGFDPGTGKDFSAIVGIDHASGKGYMLNFDPATGKYT